MCCSHDKIRLPSLHVPPQPLFNLFTADTAQARDFRSNIMQYNASLAFTSLGVKVNETLLNRGPPVFRIHGELRNPYLLATYSYTYMILWRPIVNVSHAMTIYLFIQCIFFNRCYQLTMPIRLYHHAYEVLHMNNGPNYMIRLCVNPGNDLCHYNLPTANEVGIILPGENVFQGDHCDIIIHLCPQYYHDPHDHCDHLQLQQISEGHAAYMPLHYILLFPYGEPGWYYELRCPNNPRCITLLQYTAYCIHSRPNEFSTILCGCRLFQWYLVDMFVCIDQQQLYFIWTQQNKLQVTLLNGLEDVLSMNDNLIDLNQLGLHIILPSSYLSGPRDMHQHYLDGMAIARHFKKIDIFLTMTANPGWPEIK